MHGHYPIMIVGGGSGGITVATLMATEPNPPAMAIIEPLTKHYYQPIWTLVGDGVFPKEVSGRGETDFVPPGTTWIHDAVVTIEPEQRTVTTIDGKVIGYDYLVVAAGLQINWDAIPGLKESVGLPGSRMHQEPVFERQHCHL